jgi:hypothetical protein
MVFLHSHPIAAEGREEGSEFTRKTDGVPRSGVKSLGQDEQDEQDADRPSFVGNPVHLVNPVERSCGTAVVLLLLLLNCMAAEPPAAPIRLPYNRDCPVIYENDYVDI